MAWRSSPPASDWRRAMPRAAREFLEMAPADAAGLLALAEFHRSHGTLERRVGARESDREPQVHSLAARAAPGGGQSRCRPGCRHRGGGTRLAAAMSALAGDPLPWLRGLPEGFEEDASAAAYAAVAIRRWLGQKVRSSDLEAAGRRTHLAQDHRARGRDERAFSAQRDRSGRAGLREIRTVRGIPSFPVARAQ